MDLRFDAIQSNPANAIFHVVFFPDRIYHASYLNATRSSRYRYNVQEVRSKTDANVLKGEVYLDEVKLTNFIRIEYRAGRLLERSREKKRLLAEEVRAWIRLAEGKDKPGPEAEVILRYCPWVDAWQCEVWQSLECPSGRSHDYKVVDQMGWDGTITSVSAFAELLANPRRIKIVNLVFKEGRTKPFSGYGISDQEVQVDNFYGRNVQVPMTQSPSDSSNTVMVENYEVDFQRGYYIDDVSAIPPVNYRNAMMIDRPENLQKFADRFFGGDVEAMKRTNITSMRWIFQQELGSNLVFFHHVTIPPLGVEGTHQHVGSEELYYITSGEGIAYLGENDDPEVTRAATFQKVQMPVFGLDERPMWELPVKPGSVIFTKSGGMHGIRNVSADRPLEFIAFLYHAH